MSWDGFRVSLRVSRLLGTFPFDRDYLISRPWLLYSGVFVTLSLLDAYYVMGVFSFYIGGFQFYVLALQMLQFVCVVILFPVWGYRHLEALVGVIHEVDSIDLRLKLRKTKRVGGKILMISFVMFSFCLLVTVLDMMLHDFSVSYVGFAFTYNANWLILECLVLQFTLFVSGLERRLGVICGRLKSAPPTTGIIELCVVHLLLTGACERVNGIYSLRLLYLMAATFVMMLVPSFFGVVTLTSSPLNFFDLILFLTFFIWVFLTFYQLLQVVRICSLTTKKAGIN
jgi:hypothetical protein